MELLLFSYSGLSQIIANRTIVRKNLNQSAPGTNNTRHVITSYYEAARHTYFNEFYKLMIT